MHQRKLPKRQSKYQRKAEPIFKHFPVRKAALIVFRVLVVVALVGGLLYLFFYSNKFNISEVKISGSSEYVSISDLYNVVSSNATGKNIFKYDLSSLQTSLKTTFLGAKNITAKKVYPNTIVVFVEERSPIAILQKEAQHEQYLIDDEGYILGLITQDSYSYLPKLSYNEEIVVGTFLNKELVPKYTELLKVLAAADIKASSVSIYSDRTEFYTDSGAQVLISSEKIARKYINALSAVLLKAHNEGESIKKVDLRYDKVIVLFNKESENK